MSSYLLQLEITGFEKGFYTIAISLDKSKTKLYFSPETKELRYSGKDELTKFLKLKEFQLRKILHNKQPETFFTGFKLNFVLRDISPDPRFYDRTKITVLDNTENKYIVCKTDKKSDNLLEVYTDGSFQAKSNSGAYAVLIKKDNGEDELVSFKTNKKGSNLIELAAVIKCLELLKDESKLCIHTDSQYVIKGITEWVPVWLLNDWFTANGTKAKNINYWKKVYSLTKNKYIEFAWIKAHTQQPENTLCDKTAKETAKMKEQ